MKINYLNITLLIYIVFEILFIPNLLNRGFMFPSTESALHLLLCLPFGLSWLIGNFFQPTSFYIIPYIGVIYINYHLLKLIGKSSIKVW